MKIRTLTEHETTALMIITHVAAGCIARRSPAIPLAIALSHCVAGPLDANGKKSFKRLIDAGLEHQLLVQQGSDIFVGQLGQMIMAFSEISRGTPENFEEQTRDHDVLERVLTAIARDNRFSPDHLYDEAPGMPPPSTRTFDFGNKTGPKTRNTRWSAIPEAVPASTGVYWLGFAVFAIVIWGLLAILMR